MSEYITIEISKEQFDEVYKSGLISDYKLKKVEVRDEFFENDEHHRQLKKASDKAYKDLKTYEFRKRHGIKD